jgi:hypothetical protein
MQISSSFPLHRFFDENIRLIGQEARELLAFYIYLADAADL